MTLERAPFYPIIPDEPEAQAYWVLTTDGVRLRVAAWDHASAKGTVLLFPGRTEYIEKYAETAGRLAEQGFATISIDWRGQGLADRLTENVQSGHVIHFQDYQLDVAAMLRSAKALNIPEPYFLLGHSMGGCIGLRALHDGLPVRAAAFTGPMWDIGLNPILRPIAVLLSGIASLIGIGHWLTPGTKHETYVLDTAFEDNQLTKDRDMYARLQSQARAKPELMIGGPTLRWLSEALKECRKLRRLPAPDLPGLTFLGTDEKIVSTAAIKTCMAGWNNGTLDMVAAGEHEVLMDNPKIRGDVVEKTAQLFNAQTLSTD
ncbi:alpha/beta hydrolase [Cognatishimia sp. WU-CL00825]|uniref:alpha/beta hydrolase n=1 Tax=Cognatishimia sp. WU-CL00825 TaxID=3127658 RepID=UPI0031089401